MATYLDEIRNDTLYRRKFFLPINEKDKRHNSLIFLLSNSFMGSYELRNNPFAINANKSFISYYMEPNVKYYMNIQENTLVSQYENLDLIDEDVEIFGEFVVSEAKDDDKNYGLPDLKKYPMPDAQHVKSAIKFFNYVDKEHEEQLANAIKRNIKKFGIEKINVGSKNRFSKYAKSMKQVNIIESSIVQESVEEDNSLLLEPREKEEVRNIEELHSTEIDRRLKPEYFVSEDTFILTESQIDSIINEASNYNNKLKMMLYKDRIKNNKEALKIFKNVKEIDKKIKYTYLNINRYKEMNLFVDLYYYNDLFLKNIKLPPIKGNDLYLKFISNLITDKRYDNNYKQKSVFIPVKESEYKTKKDSLVWDFRYNINILAALSKAIKEKNPSLTKLDGYTFVFIGNNGYFKTDKLSELLYSKFIVLLKKLYNKEIIADPEENKDSPKAIKTQIINTIENSKSVEINNLVGKTTDEKKTKERVATSDIKISAEPDKVENDKKARVEKDKEEIVDIVDQHSKNASSVDDALNSMNNELDADYFKQVLKDLENNSSNHVKINATRAARMNDLNNKFLKKKVNNESIQDLINQSQENTPLPKTELDIDTVNEEWKDLQGSNFEKAYNINEDIYSILYSLKDKTYPVSIIDINVEDTSTSEDHVYTYTVNCEDSFGTRFTLKFDIPKFRNDRFMRLKGNEKTINGQLLLLPIIKTDQDTVQIVTSYKKIFIRRYGESTGKSIPQADAVMKALDKYKGSNIKVISGDTRRICSKYELPIDYLDFSKVYSKIIAQNGKDKYEFYFNQDDLRKEYKIDDSKGIPYGVYNGKEVLYYTGTTGTISGRIQAFLSTTAGEEFATLLDSATRRKKYTYSRASILSTEIPLIVVMAYSEGLISALNKAKVVYELSEKRPKIPGNYDLIKFKDGYLKYLVEYDSSLLLNGLKDCDTENYSIADINNKEMWTDFLDAFGGRIKADGLDNFYDLTMDPITVDICKIYGLPTDYIEVLAYANSLLADNKYNKHVDISGNRYRTNEQIAALFYEAICESYERYKLEIKNGRGKPTMTMKQDVVIDKLMAQPTFSDLSVFSPVLEYEAANAVSFKGKSGMNSDRSYGLDKRIYDESMVNVLALSTGFAGNVGLTRQTTIDKNISGKRGLIKQSTPEDMNTTKALCMTEALTPFGSTHDDPFRSAMTFVQTSKHSMRTEKQSPLLITNGADQALAYLCSDMFAYKSKGKGKVAEITKDYMIVEYNDGGKDFIDLRENIKKNSDGGVFEILKLDTDLKVGDTVKQDQILAYDKKSFVTNTGSGNLSAAVGILSKVAVLETDEN